MKQVVSALCVLLSVCVLADEDLMTNGNRVVDSDGAAMLYDWCAAHQSVTNNHAVQKLPLNREMIRNSVIASRVISVSTAKETCKMVKTAKGKGRAGILAAIAAILVAVWVMLFADYPVVALVGGIVIIVVIVLSAIFVRKKRKAAGSSNQQRV